MNEFNEFYPVSDTILNCPGGLWQLGMILKLEEHLRNAQRGSGEAESKLCNRIGQLRRCVPFNVLTTNLQEKVGECIKWLRTTGRVLDLKNEDPRQWISNRNGGPRW